MDDALNLVAQTKAAHMAIPLNFRSCGADSAVHFEHASAVKRATALVRGEHGYHVIVVDCTATSSWDAYVREIGLNLDFPRDEMGDVTTNFNAVLDWLTDLSWYEQVRGVVVCLSSAERFLARWPYEAGALIEIWLKAADSWGKDGVPFHLVFELSEAT